MNRVRGLLGSSFQAWRHQQHLQLPAPASMVSSRRAMSLYEQINLMEKVAEESGLVRFTGYSDTDFTINGVSHEGSVVCFGTLVLTWKPLKLSEVTPDSLSIFQLLRPAPDLLLLGCGRRIVRVDQSIRDFLRSNGIKLEVIDSRNGASTFNFLNEEGRAVAAAMLPYGSEP